MVGRNKDKTCNSGRVYTEEEAVAEAKRCLQCAVPLCEQGCPAHRPIKEVNRLIAERKFDSALALVRGVNPFPSITSRICAQERQCEGACVLAGAGKAIRIGKLEEFLAEYERKKITEKIKKSKSAGGKKTNKNKTAAAVGSAAAGGKKTNKTAAVVGSVAVVGSGVAGLACAYELALRGFGVTVFEQRGKFGGIAGQMIPDFRLAGIVVEREVQNLREMGVMFEAGRKITSVKALLGRFGFVFLGIGAGEDMCLGAKGEGTEGVIGALAFLQGEKWGGLKLKKGETVLIIGGGNSAMDAARVAARAGAEAVVAYRRTEKEMPSRALELEHAKKEGVKFEFLLSPGEFLGGGKEKNKLTAVLFERMRLGKPDSSGRSKPEPTGETKKISASWAVIACGQASAVQQMNDAGIELDEKGNIKVDEKFRTSVARVYAAGDAVTGPRTAIEAIRDGRAAARAIAEEAGT
ncbi:MAG: FAD-dependent oxidoreductase [Candidatus Diapherotrites archaeon]